MSDASTASQVIYFNSLLVLIMRWKGLQSNSIYAFCYRCFCLCNVIFKCSIFLWLYFMFKIHTCPYVSSQYQNQQPTEGFRRMDNPKIRRGLDKLTSSLNQIGDTFEKAFEVRCEHVWARILLSSSWAYSFIYKLVSFILTITFYSVCSSSFAFPVSISEQIKCYFISVYICSMLYLFVSWKIFLLEIQDKNLEGNLR